MGRWFVALAGLAMLSACAQSTGFSDIRDPYETENRARHEFNRAADSAFVGPAAGAYGDAVPPELMRGVANFSSNLSLPRAVLNNVLQLRLDRALANTLRLGMNSTIGIGGLFDPASAIGLDKQTGDFGQTLHVWGFGEGNYLELPFIGPSTERDMVGMVVDLVANPLNFVVPWPERAIGPVTAAIARIGQRAEFADLVDSLLYESADSYAQARILYLQSRRREVQGGLTDDDLEDPYDF